ncbi:MAG: hypothetical protein BSR46_02685 [Candidatus Dactylopiibacterium carminicum]|uniref:beta-ketoacyl synthase N-terminal-like domain-containing protein n=1 Tax=Candidatus Dactylopiibacterium carminicum TaxID=857335 RepID=UPI000BDD6D2B|nr:beta-ketoacyl synthase N-terminal-like domain-containing protein [Candidatus Dactylopiibacterium carminicum]PAT00463.1 MAG: hypothetical protein BSR46_02685 [Candidatus Dactylopiibacterium carminicum]
MSGKAPVFIQGRGLVCALGADLPAALECLRSGGVEPARPETGPAWPCFAIADADADWQARAQRLVRQAVTQCGPLDHEAPLFIASCSLDIGALETLPEGIPPAHDCLRLPEAIAAWLDWRGPLFWFSTACTSASAALLQATEHLRGGHATLVLEDCARRPNSRSDFSPTHQAAALRPAEAGPTLRPWRILGRHFGPLPADWRAQLAQRLGGRPRRLGEWAELALFGALHCLEDAGESSLPAQARLRLSSIAGPTQALQTALAEYRADGQPLPLGFLQSQPNQALAHLAKALGWQGDACCLTSRETLASLRLVCQSGATELLLGWVDEGGKRSDWLRLQAYEETDLPVLTDFAALADRQLTDFRLQDDL